ncbi:MAG: DUF4097 family beta strand repeat-containing protein [Sphaerochaetaceae bacterium]|nr:DUF4097 family beta strand repeat-containing protein [Sphaerochaetaceae bacterium]
MKRLLLIVVLILAFVVALTAVIVSRNPGSNGVMSLYKYDNASKYTAGPGSVDASKVSDLHVDWVSGSVTIVEGDVSSVRFDESCKTTLDAKTCMYWYLDGSTLRIKWCRSGLSKASHQSSKDLTVVVPRGMLLNSLEVSSVSSSILSKVDALNCKVNGVSGPVSLDGSYADSVTVNNVSGSVNLCYGVCPKKVSIDVVSGSAVLAIPAQSGFTATLHSVSGKFSCDIPTSVNSGKYVAGDGKASIKMDSVSGSLKIQAN